VESLSDPILIKRQSSPLSSSLTMFARAARLSSRASSHFSPVSYRPIALHLHLQQQRNMTTYKLNTGASIPALGFGTWQDKEDQEAAVAEALKAGYRHIDTARG
jgi:alcohol dehydrogenase (NADP+)